MTLIQIIWARAGCRQTESALCCWFKMGGQIFENQIWLACSEPSLANYFMVQWALCKNWPTTANT